MGKSNRLAAEVFKTIKKYPEGISVIDLCKKTGVSKSSIYSAINFAEKKYKTNIVSSFQKYFIKNGKTKVSEGDMIPAKGSFKISSLSKDYSTDEKEILTWIRKLPDSDQSTFLNNFIKMHYNRLVIKAAVDSHELLKKLS